MRLHSIVLLVCFCLFSVQAMAGVTTHTPHHAHTADHTTDNTAGMITPCHHGSHCHNSHMSAAASPDAAHASAGAGPCVHCKTTDGCSVNCAVACSAMTGIVLSHTATPAQQPAARLEMIVPPALFSANAALPPVFPD
ncbi:MAG: hypothetical protein AAF404_07370 [Pseudomonadota bacterium]